jgi:hypothetical protein
MSRIRSGVVVWGCSAAILVGCGKPPVSGAAQPATSAANAAQARKAADGVLPNLAYQFLGPQLLVFRFDADAAKVRALINPAFQPEVRNGKSAVFAILAEYEVAGVVGLPAYNLKAREITYTVLCEKTGEKRDRPGFASFQIVEDQHVFTWLVRDVGYPALTAPLKWQRAGDRIESTGEADFALTRKTDAWSRVERTASLTRLLLGKNDHLMPRKGEVTEVPFIYPLPVLDGYGVKVDRARFGTLEKLGLVESGQKPSDVWWWEGVNFIVGQRKRYPGQ